MEPHSSTLAPIALGALFVGVTAYGVAVIRQRRAKFASGWNPWRSLSFTAGSALLALALSPPLADFAHHDFRGHMVQHLLLGMLAPLGLALGAPMTLLLRTVPASMARRVTRFLRAPLVRVVGHPVTALTLNVGGMYLLYLTPLYAMTFSHPWLHGLVHWHFIAAGYLFVWAIAGPDPAPHRPQLAVRLGVLFFAIGAHAILGKVMYAYLWPRDTHHSAEEIQAGAKLMYYGGDVAELLLAVALFATWYVRRNPRGEIDCRAEIPQYERT